MANEELFGDEHVRRYQETDGAEGYEWRNGTTILLLTTVGRRSGKPRTHALIFRELDGHPVVVASKGGNPEDPEWYKNMQVNREVQVQIKGDVFTALPEDASGDERSRYWDAMAEVWPDYDAYQAKTERIIPVVILRRVS
jgi:deazaflavin-dependent oxidoreductase (nitroreductase family)